MSAAIFPLGAAAAVAALKWAACTNTSTIHGEKQDDREDGKEEIMRTSQEPFNGIPLPTHLQREMYKEGRREKMIPKLTRTKPMYDNVVMSDPNGTVLSTVSIKKANWYVRKNFAVWCLWGEGKTEQAIQLLFQPETTTSCKIASPPSTTCTNPKTAQSNTVALREYNSSIKENRCVGCGVERDYMKHYIVPYCYRTKFPDHFKTHLPHDIVILCASRCHLRAQQATYHRMNTLEQRERKRRQKIDLSPTSGQAELVDPYKYRVRSAATALLQWKAKLPDSTISSYEQIISEWAREHESTLVDAADDKNTPTLRQLEAASLLECRSPNPLFVSGAELLVDTLRSRRKNDGGGGGDGALDEDALTDFVRGWRQHFLDIVHPRYLPKGWSVDAPVQSDRRKRSQYE